VRVPDRLVDRWRRLSVPARWAGGLAAGLAAAEVILAAIGYATGGAGPEGPPLSSYATTPRGLAAYAELLRDQGRAVTRLRTGLDDTRLDPAATLVLLGPDRVGAAEAGALRDFLGSGGRLIAGGPQPDWLRRVTPGAPKWLPAGAPEVFPLAPVDEVDGVRRVRTDGRGSWAAGGDALPLLGGDGVVASVASAGPGRVVLLADASMLSNRRLGDADNAAFGLAAAGAGRPVLFAENAHGYAAATGLSALPGRWRAALSGLLLATLLGMWSAVRRLGPPEEPGRPFTPPRHAFVDAQGANLARTRSPEEAIAPLKAAARERLRRRAGLGPLAGKDALQAAGPGLGLTPAETGALVTPVTADADVVAAGSAAAKLARAGTAPPTGGGR